MTGLHGGLGPEFSKMGMGFGYEMSGWRRLDLEKPTQRVLRHRELCPDAVIHCPPGTNVDLCENDSDRVLKVNAETPDLLVETAQELGLHFIFSAEADYSMGKRKALIFRVTCAIA